MYNSTSVRAAQGKKPLLQLSKPIESKQTGYRPISAHGNHIHRIHTHTILHHLKMQVETCAVAGIAYITYNLPCRYRFTCGNGSLRHVGIARGKSRTVIQQHLIAIAVVPAADQNRAAVGSQDGCALRCWNIRAAMPGIAEGVHFPEVAGYICTVTPSALANAA